MGIKKLASIGRAIEYPGLDIVNLGFSEIQQLGKYDAVIISGGDGLIRRVVRALNTVEKKPLLILNPTGSFNVVAKAHRTPRIERVLEKIAADMELREKEIPYYRLGNDIFVFSAGNMGDLHHIFLSESLRFGWLRQGSLKYFLAVLFLLPMHLFLTPFMLLSDKRFFIFTPFGFPSKFGTFFGRIDSRVVFDLQNSYNILELDGDIVVIEESVIEIEPKGKVTIVVG